MKTKVNDIVVFTSGDKEKKPIIFVHGFPFDHLMWDEQVASLNKNYFCVTYDIRGLGESDPGDGQYNMDSFVYDLEAVLNNLKLDSPVLCGLSMGGYISLRAMEKIQEKFCALILCDTKSAADNNEAKIKRFDAIKRINKGDFSGFVSEFVINCFYEEFISHNRKVFEKILERSQQNKPAGVKGCLLAMAARTDTTESLSQIKLPALIICGSEDKLSPPDVMMSMSDKIKGSSFILVEDAGHMAPVEKPKIVTEAIKNFLKNIK